MRVYASVTILLLISINLFCQKSIIVWDNEFKVIFYSSLKSEPVNPISLINTISDTLKYEKRSISSDSVGKVTSLPAESFLVCYIGERIKHSLIDSNTFYLKKYAGGKMFYKEERKGFYLRKQNDSSFIQEHNMDEDVLKAHTNLSDGQWYLFGVSEDKVYLIREGSIKEHTLNGDLKEYSTEGAITKRAKYKHGYQIDTSFQFQNGHLSSYEIRDQNGKFRSARSFYPLTNTVWLYSDANLGYEFTFFENGVIESVSKKKPGSRLLLEFNEKGELIKRIFIPEK